MNNQLDYDFILTVVATLILLAGVFDDLRSRKIHNKLILILIPIAILSVFVTNFFRVDWIFAFRSLLEVSLASGFIALLLGLALYMAKVLGGGDVKLYFVFALVAGIQATVGALILSFIWGGLLGIFMSVLKNQWKSLLQNIFSLFKFQKLPREKLQFLPFSVVLFLGWISFQVLKDLNFI